MKKKFPAIFRSAAALLVLVNFCACKIGDDTASVVRDNYTFDLTYTLTNVKKSYTPGDVIFLEFSLPDKLMTDLTTGEQIRVGNARIFPTLRVLDLDPLAHAGEDLYTLATLSGEVIEDEDFETLGYLKANLGCPAGTTYDLKLGLGFLEPGGYLIFLDHGAESPYHSFPFTSADDCSVVSENFISDEADVGFVQFFFGLADVNRDVYDAFVAMKPNWDETAAEALEKGLDEKRAFFVRVE